MFQSILDDSIDQPCFLVRLSGVGRNAILIAYSSHAHANTVYVFDPPHTKVHQTLSSHSVSHNRTSYANRFHSCQSDSSSSLLHRWIGVATVRRSLCAKSSHLLVMAFTRSRRACTDHVMLARDYDLSVKPYVLNSGHHNGACLTTSILEYIYHQMRCIFARCNTLVLHDILRSLLHHGWSTTKQRATSAIKNGPCHVKH